MNLLTQKRQSLFLKSFAIAAATFSVINPSPSEAVTCLLGDIGKITCTSYDFGVPFNIIAPASPALTAIGTHLDASAITHARGISAGVRNENSGVITSAIALDIQPPVNSGGGTITNSYGIYIGNPTAATNNYSIYSAGGKNYFAGNTDVAGTLRTNTICDLTGANCKDVTAGWASGGGSGSVTQVNTGTGLTGGPITNTGTLAVDVGTTANKIVQLDSSARLPAVSGENLTNVSAAKILDKEIHDFYPSEAGQVLRYTGAHWIPQILSIFDIQDLVPLIASRLDSAKMPANCYANQTLTFSSPTGFWNCSDIIITPSALGSQGQGLVLAGPVSGSGTPSFRALQVSDLPPGSAVSKWQESSGKIYRATGNVGIGTTNPQTALDVAGPAIIGNSTGAKSLGVATFLNWDFNTTNYIHIRLPYSVNLHSHMYHIKVTGYAFLQAKDIDLTYVGYCYQGGGTITYTSSRDPQSAFSPTQYVGSDGYVYLRFKPSDTYGVSFVVDSTVVGSGRIIKPGEITITSSSSATL